MPAPVITGINIPTGTTLGGTVVIIYGTNLNGVTGVTFGGTAATSVSNVFDPDLSFTIVCLTPAHAAGLVNVVVTTGGGSGTGTNLFTFEAPISPAYNVLLWDDCCHIWVSDSTGETFVQGATPGGSSTPAPNDSGFNPHGNISTLANAWTDGQMAINDVDYLTFVGVDSDYNSGSGPYGIIAISPSEGTNLSYTLFDPSPGAPAFSGGNKTQSYIRAAVSGNATTVLLARTDDFTGNVSYPRITHDGGTTWGNVTGVTGNLTWVGACCGSTASQTMYLQPSASFPWGSTDWGTTWTELTTGPNGILAANANEAKFRMRCSANGQTVCRINLAGVFHISKNGGSTWSSIDFPSTFSITLDTLSNADLGITPDGQTIVVCMEKQLASRNYPAVFISTHGGTSFSDISGNIQYPFSRGAPAGGAPTSVATGCTQCNVSPDGLGVIVTFNFMDFGPVQPDGLDGSIGYVNVSTDGGTTFKLRSFNADPYQSDSVLGLFTGIYMTPSQITPVGSGRRWFANPGPIRVYT